MNQLDRHIRTDITMQVVARDGQIHLLFSEADQTPAFTSNFMLDASDALTMSSLIADLAFEADSGLRIPEAQKAELSLGNAQP